MSLESDGGGALRATGELSDEGEVTESELESPRRRRGRSGSESGVLPAADAVETAAACMAADFSSAVPFLFMVTVLE